MRYLKTFKTLDEYVAALESGSLHRPATSYIKRERVMRYDEYVDKPLYVEAISPLTVSFTNPIEYSLDNSTWNALPKEQPSQTINEGEKIYFRASGLTATSSEGIGHFTISGECKLGGNIMSMVYGEGFSGKTTLTQSSVFYYMFSNQTTIVDASSLSLPATSLSANCYYGMFEGCQNLVKAPALPSTNLSSRCYLRMFFGCYRLIKAPELPATILSEACYNNMFNECTNLVEAPVLAATTMTYACYSNMFSKCKSLVNAPALPATTLDVYCYNNMFLECTNLETAPVLPAQTLMSNCYRQMFQHCQKIDYIKVMCLTQPSNTYSQYWVRGVKSTGIFVKNSAATWSNEYNESVIPSGWSVQTATE